MRRLLDLNQPSTTFVKVIGFFLVLLPAVLFGILRIWSAAGSIRTLLLSLIKVSLVVGASVFIVFVLLIAVEQIQDHYFDAHFQKQRDQKVALADGCYECQYCGNRRVGETDRTCNVCGQEFVSIQTESRRN